MRSFHECGNAALHCDITAQKISGAFFDPGRIRIQASRRVLGGHEWNTQVLFQFKIIINIGIC